jgi:hypothetical protein
MNRYIFSGFVVLLFASQLLTAQDVAARNHEPPALGLHWAKGFVMLADLTGLRT